MNEEKIITEKLIKQIRDYANGRKADIARGAETPTLAALLLQKYGFGLADAVNIFYDNLRASDILIQVLDEETSKIDPQWREHNKERWTGQPADIITCSENEVNDKIQKAINYTKASFSMEGMDISEDQEKRIYNVLSGKSNFEDVKEELIKTYKEN